MSDDTPHLGVFISRRDLEADRMNCLMTLSMIAALGG